MAGPNDNPFARVFSPSRGGLVGTIGRIAGFPSDKERLLSSMGQAQATGLQALQERINGGADPATALTEFMQSPEGVDFLVNGGEFGDLTSYLDKTNPTPEFQTLSPGTMYGTTDPRTGQFSTQGTVPYAEPEAVRTFKEFGSLAMLGEEELAGLAKAKLVTLATGDPTQEEAALGRLRDAGLIDQTTMDQHLAGVIQTEVDGYTGRPVIINTLTQQRLDPTDGGGAPAPAGTDPAAAPGEGGPQDPYNYSGPPPANIINYAGPIASVQQSLSRIGGELSPGLAAPELNKARTALEKIRNAAVGLRTNTRLKADVEAVTGMADVRPDTPLVAGQKLLSFMNYIQTRDNQAYADLASNASSKEARQAADEWLRSSRPIWELLPAKGELEEELRKIQSGETATPAVRAIQGARDAATTGADAMIETREQTRRAAAAPKSGAPKPDDRTPKSYTSQNEMLQGFKKGEFKIGDIVIVNGREMRVAPKGQ